MRAAQAAGRVRYAPGRPQRWPAASPSEHRRTAGAAQATRHREPSSADEAAATARVNRRPRFERAPPSTRRPERQDDKGGAGSGRPGRKTARAAQVARRTSMRSQPAHRTKPPRRLRRPDAHGLRNALVLHGTTHTPEQPNAPFLLPHRTQGRHVTHPVARASHLVRHRCHRICYERGMEYKGELRVGWIWGSCWGFSARDHETRTNTGYRDITE